jgi:hypothetical protein
MNLKIAQVVQLWEQVKFSHVSYLQGVRSYGEARYVMPAWDMEIIHARRVIWGPVRKWGTDYPLELKYEVIEISHAEFYVEVQAPYNTLLYYCKDRGRKHLSHAWFKDKYDLDWVGDVSYLKDFLTYVDLINGT